MTIENKSNYKIRGRLQLGDGADLLFSETDPVLGIPAPLSSFCWYDTHLYMKVGTGDGDWEIFVERFEQLEYTGFISWEGAGDYWSRTGDQFTILRGGIGRIQTYKVYWPANQTITLTANQTNYVRVGLDGVVTVSTTADYQGAINLFEVLYDGTNVVVVKENHPYKFPSSVSSVLHNIIGVVFHGKAGALARVIETVGNTADHRRAKFVGEDVLEDHGLSTTVSEANPITWQVWYKNASGNWVMNTENSELDNTYIEAGVPTLAADKKSCLYTLYTVKDDLNSGAARWIALPHTAVFADLNKVQEAIGFGNFTTADNELKKIEMAQVGFASVRRQAGNIYIDWVTTAKDTAGLRVAQLGSSGNHLLLADIQAGMYGDGGHYNLVSWKDGGADPTVSEDVTNTKPLTLWRNTGNSTVHLCTDNTDEAAKWVRLFDGVRVWETGKQYLEGMVVSWNGLLFKVSATHISSVWDLSKVTGINCEIVTEAYDTLDVVYLASSGWELARADSVDTLSEPIHVVLMGDGTRSLIVSGGKKFTVVGHGLTGVRYLSVDTAGAVGDAPTTGIKQAIYEAIDADTIMVLNGEGVEI
jgi:hypothetical protein